MEPLNVCIEKNKERLNNFLEDLTRVETLEQHLNVSIFACSCARMFVLSFFFLLCDCSWTNIWHWKEPTKAL